MLTSELLWGMTTADPDLARILVVDAVDTSAATEWEGYGFAWYVIATTEKFQARCGCRSQILVEERGCKAIGVVYGARPWLVKHGAASDH